MREATPPGASAIFGGLTAPAEHRERGICHKADPAEIKQVVQSFADFVDLCTRKQRGTGKPCLIAAATDKI